MRRRAAVFACALFGLAIAQEPARDDSPRYAADGRLLLPANYREWIFLSSGLGMTYSANEGGSKDPSFTNVFVSPSAYRSFQRTGTWPDKTTLVLEVRDSQARGSINLGGHYQSGLAAVEVEVKDASRFPGKWAFFGFGASPGPAKQIPVTASCYGCHATNGAVDNTFVQFYPTLLSVARTKGTVKPHAGE